MGVAVAAQMPIYHLKIHKSYKKFSEGKQVHVGVEALKTNRTRWERYHNTFTPSLASYLGMRLVQCR